MASAAVGPGVGVGEGALEATLDKDRGVDEGDIKNGVKLISSKLSWGSTLTSGSKPLISSLSRAFSSSLTPPSLSSSIRVLSTVDHNDGERAITPRQCLQTCKREYHSRP